MPIQAMGNAAAHATSTAGAPVSDEYGKKVRSAAPTAKIHAPKIQADLRQGEAARLHDPGVLALEQMAVAFPNALVFRLGKNLLLAPALEIAQVLLDFVRDQ